MITHRFHRLIKDNSGQAMIAALVIMVLGGLIITPLVSYAGTSVNNVSLKKNHLQGLYAADAGIEDVLWSLKHSTTPNTSLTQTINGMQVTMNTVSMGDYTLVAGDWVTPGGPHSIDLSVTTDIDWDSGHNAYKYTVTCTWSGAGLCKLIEVGARLPDGYDYEESSAALFSENLSTDEPTNELDGQDAHLLSWSLPSISITERTQIFYLTGSGEVGDCYSWATASRDDVGDVGELTGTFYTVTATATNQQSGLVANTVESDVMKNAGSLYIISWRVLR